MKITQEQRDLAEELIDKSLWYHGFDDEELVMNETYEDKEKVRKEMILWIEDLLKNNEDYIFDKVTEFEMYNTYNKSIEFITNIVVGFVDNN